MAIRKCPQCNTANTSDAVYCRNCGKKLMTQIANGNVNNTSKQNESGCLSDVIGGFAIIIAWVLIGGGIVCVFSGMIAGLLLTGVGILILVVTNVLSKE